MRKALKVLRDPRKTAPAPRSRPYALESRENLLRRFDAAIQGTDGSEGAHCLHELWMRGEFPARIEAGLTQLWQHAAATIPEWLPMRYVSWLAQVYEIAARFQAVRRPTKRGRNGLYLVLLDYSDRRGDPYGVYVGMSRYPAAQRFDQHKAGIRASGSVLKRGLEVLTGPVLHLQRLQRADAARLEAQLAEALADAGIHVEGGH